MGLGGSIFWSARSRRASRRRACRKAEPIRRGDSLHSQRSAGRGPEKSHPGRPSAIPESPGTKHPCLANPGRSSLRPGWPKERRTEGPFPQSRRQGRRGRVDWQVRRRRLPGPASRQWLDAQELAPRTLRRARPDPGARSKVPGSGRPGRRSSGGTPARTKGRGSRPRPAPEHPGSPAGPGRPLRGQRLRSEPSGRGVGHAHRGPLRPDGSCDLVPGRTASTRARSTGTRVGSARRRDRRLGRARSAQVLGAASTSMRLMSR